MPKYKALSNSAENKISKIESHFANLEEQARVQKQQWHSEVDRIFDNLNSEMKSLKDRHMTVLRSVQSQLSSQNRSMVQNKDILNSNNMSLITLYPLQVQTNGIQEMSIYTRFSTTFSSDKHI